MIRDKKRVRIEKSFSALNNKLFKGYVVAEYSHKNNFNGFVSGVYLYLKDAQKYADWYYKKFFALCALIFLFTLPAYAVESAEDINKTLAIQTIYLEAEHNYESYLSVAEVIRNRQKKVMIEESSELHWSSVSGFENRWLHHVLMSKWQFSCWNSDKKTVAYRINALKKLTPETWQIVAKAWHESEYSNITYGALYYYNPSLVKPKWNFDVLEKTVKIGSHVFYTDKRG